MHLLIIRLEMLPWKLSFRCVVVCHMRNICLFCCLTFQTEPQTPSTGTQTGAASMPSVTNLTVTWRGERNKVRSIQTHVLRGINSFLDHFWCALLQILTVVSYTNSRPQLATRLLAHKIQSPQEWEAMQALLVSLNLSHQMFHQQLLQQRTDPGAGGCIYGQLQILGWY